TLLSVQTVFRRVLTERTIGSKLCGICNKDVYNFNKASFIIGKITTQLVITGVERRGRPKTLQPGNREWVTLIAAISAAGWSVPPISLV
ncbi:uncharacterized protein M421DRAFT_414642, partial [Didymella exigua CBS 183.55]